MEQRYLIRYFYSLLRRNNMRSDKIKSFFDITMLRFMIVGVVNTLFGSAVMFSAYNLLHFSYWISSALNYILGNVLSYFLNKHYTFRSRNKSPKTILRFLLNAVACYGIAYGIARPLMAAALSGMEMGLQDNCAMLVGMCLYTALNYLGQRYFVFRS